MSRGSSETGRVDGPLTAEAQALRAATGIPQPAVLGRLLAVGIDAERAALLPLLPLVEVAWADGGTGSEKRRRVLDLAALTDLPCVPRPWGLLLRLLAERPPHELFRAGEVALAAMLAQLPRIERATVAAELRALCRTVARPSAGSGGLRALSGAERRVIDRLVAP